MKKNLKLKQKNKLPYPTDIVEKWLIKSSLFLLILLLCIQILFYNKIGNEILNSVYYMEGNHFSQSKTQLFYHMLGFNGDIPIHENVLIRKNGIPVEQLKNGIPVYVYVYDGDIIEIDARKASGSKYEVSIDNISCKFIPKNFLRSIVIEDKLYRFPSFSEKTTCTR